MNCSQYRGQTDYGPDPYITNMEQMAVNNHNFRTAIWTGSHLQMTMMCIPPCKEIGLEMHGDTDQLIRIEHGEAEVRMGRCEKRQDFRKHMCVGDAVFVPAGTWHNVVNTGRNPLRISSVYAPPNHPAGTVHRTKADAEKEEY